MRHGVGSVFGILGLILSLGGCEESSGGNRPTSPSMSGSGAGGSSSEPECQFDFDEDGYCDERFSSPNPDCDDGDSEIHPGAEEVANAIDDDCDGVIDNGLTAA